MVYSINYSGCKEAPFALSLAFRTVVSSNSFAYWLFHAITFEVFENPRVKIQEKPKRNP